MPGPVFLAGDRLTLRPIEPEDLDVIQRWANHPEIRRYVRDFRLPYTRSAAETWLREAPADADRVDLLCCVDGDPVGRARLVPLDEQHRRANLGFLVDPDHQGNGYATEAGEVLVEYGFEERRLHRIEARALAPNEGSQAVLEALGFVREGRKRSAIIADGDYVDELYCRPKADLQGRTA